MQRCMKQSRLELNPEYCGVNQGQLLQQQPVLRVEDIFQNVIVQGFVSVSLYSDTGVPVPIYGTTNVSLQAGSATFTNLQCRINGNLRLEFTFSNTAVQPVSSIVRVQIGDPHHLALLHPPSDLVAGQVAVGQPVVVIHDANDNLVPLDGARISVSLTRLRPINSSFPSPKIALWSEPTLSEDDVPEKGELVLESLDTQSQQMETLQGKAMFTNLGVVASTTELDLVMVFKAENMSIHSVRSPAFNVSDPRGVQLLELAQAPAQDFAAFGGEELTVEPVIVCADVNRSHVSMDNSTVVNVSIIQSLPCCGLLGTIFETPSLAGRTSIVAQAGTVVFTDLHIDKIGRHLLHFSAVSGAAASVHGEAPNFYTFGGVGERYPHTRAVISVNLWIIVRPGRARSLHVVQEAIAAVVDGKPVAGRSSQPFAVQPAVVLRDRGGNRISNEAAWGATAQITAALLREPCLPLPECCPPPGDFEACRSKYGTVPGMPGIEGTIHRALEKGGVLYTDLAMSILGEYRFIFYAPLLLTAVAKTTLRVEAGQAARIVVMTQPKATVIAGENFVVSAKVADLGGNLVSTYVSAEPMLVHLEQGSTAAKPTFKDAGAASRICTQGTCVFDQLVIEKAGQVTVQSVLSMIET